MTKCYHPSFFSFVNQLQITNEDVFGVFNFYSKFFLCFFSALLTYCYTGHIVLNDANVPELLHLSNFFGKCYFVSENSIFSMCYFFLSNLKLYCQTFSVNFILFLKIQFFRYLAFSNLR
jgi:hypothetical protein